MELTESQFKSQEWLYQIRHGTVNDKVFDGVHRGQCFSKVILEDLRVNKNSSIIVLTVGSPDAKFVLWFATGHPSKGSLHDECRDFEFRYEKETY